MLVKLKSIVYLLHLFFTILKLLFEISHFLILIRILLFLHKEFNNFDVMAHLG